VSDTLPNNEIDFEEPPPIARRSEHLPLLLALKSHPGESARIQRRRKLTDVEAQQLAGVVARAADKIGAGYKVVTRFIPAENHHGVWVIYKPAPDDEPTPEEKALAEASGMVAEKAAEWYKPIPPIPAESVEVPAEFEAARRRALEHPEALIKRDLREPVEVDKATEDEWEFPEPEQIPVGTERAGSA
jgi:hypothetical protein